MTVAGAATRVVVGAGVVLLRRRAAALGIERVGPVEAGLADGTLVGSKQDQHAGLVWLQREEADEHQERPDETQRGQPGREGSEAAVKADQQTTDDP